MDYLGLLKTQFNNKLELFEKRPGITQVCAPFFYPDGDMISIFIEQYDNLLRVCDFGETLMHLSYSFDLNTENKMKILNDIIIENYGQIDGGNIFVETSPDQLYFAIMRLAQIISKVSNMDILKRENIKSLFYDYLYSFIESNLSKYKPEKNSIPVKNRSDLVVDYSFTAMSRPIYLFGIKDSWKAKETTICCLEFQKLKIPFKSLVVYENLESIALKDRNRLIDITDKQFTELSAFKDLSTEYFEREIAC